MNAGAAAGAGAGASASQQAAAAQRIRFEEEVMLTGYGNSDLSEWEFKIIRGTFKKPEKLERMLEDQARFGWEYVEAFDSQRVRLRRRRSERERDGMRDGNPYDTISRAPGTTGCAGMASILLFGVLLLWL